MQQALFTIYLYIIMFLEKSYFGNIQGHLTTDKFG